MTHEATDIITLPNLSALGWSTIARQAGLDVTTVEQENNLTTIIAKGDTDSIESAWELYTNPQ